MWQPSKFYAKVDTDRINNCAKTADQYYFNVNISPIKKGLVQIPIYKLFNNIPKKSQI